MTSWRQYSSEISLLRLVLSALIILFCFTGSLAQTTPQKTRVVVGSIPIPFAICTNLGTDVTTVSKVNGMIELHIGALQTHWSLDLSGMRQG